MLINDGVMGIFISNWVSLIHMIQNQITSISSDNIEKIDLNIERENLLKNINVHLKCQNMNFVNQKDGFVFMTAVQWFLK